MKISNNNQSFVADNKITDYLLSEIHEIGKHKADFFKRFGFDIADTDTFKGSLIQHSIDRDIEKTKDSDFGIKYELKCEIKTPDESNPCIVTVWIVENGQEEPKLVTAYPTKRQYAKKIMGYTKLGKEQQKYIKAISKDQLENLRKDALKRFSDEAIGELDMTTRVQRKENNCH